MKIQTCILAITYALLSGCGGGSSPSTPEVPPMQSILPSIAQPLMPLSQGISFGVPYWSEGSTIDGGNGSAAVGGVNCSTSEEFHIHAHLSILLDGHPLAIPAKIGLKGCDYELHTHDQSGIIHEETAFSHALTLGDFFAVWGQPLRSDNVAGITGKPITAFIIQNGLVEHVTSDLRNISIQSHTEIIICIGILPATLPSFTWDPLL